MLEHLYGAADMTSVSPGGPAQQGGRAALGPQLSAFQAKAYQTQQSSSSASSSVGGLESRSHRLRGFSHSSGPGAGAGGDHGLGASAGSAGTGESDAMEELKLRLTSLQHSGSGEDREAVLGQLQRMLANAPVRPEPRTIR